MYAPTPDEINNKHGANYRCRPCRATTGLSWYRGTSCPVCSNPACIAALDVEWKQMENDGIPTNEIESAERSGSISFAFDKLINQRGVLLDAMHQISLASQNSMSSQRECGRIAREAISRFNGLTQPTGQADTQVAPPPPAEPAVDDSVVLAACQKLAPTLFTRGLKPLETDGAHWRARMHEVEATVRTVLSFAKPSPPPAGPAVEPVGYASIEGLRQLQHCNGMSVWCEGPSMWGAKEQAPPPPENLVAIYTSPPPPAVKMPWLQLPSLRPHVGWERSMTPIALEQESEQESVSGDQLPPVGSRVFIRHGRDDDAHACTVTGYYAWGSLEGDKRLHRVFVRMVYEGTTRQQARMLCDCFPSAQAALTHAQD